MDHSKSGSFHTSPAKKNPKNQQYRRSSCRAASTDIPDPLSPLLPIRSSPPAGLQSYIMYPHIAVVCMFKLVVLLLLSHMWGVHRSTSLMSSSLLLQQCPACLVCLTWRVFMMRGRWPYSWYFVGCCLLDLFNIACSILVQLPSSFFPSCFVSVQVVHPYSSIDTTTAWKKLHFILSVKSVIVSNTYSKHIKHAGNIYWLSRLGLMTYNRVTMTALIPAKSLELSSN